MTDRNATVTRSGPRRGLGLGFALICCGSALADDAGPIPWRTDLDRARAEARERGLPLWIQFTGPWCHNCRRMERSTFLHPEVVSRAREGFVPVKLRSDVYESYALSLGLSVLPSTVILGPAGEVVARFEGFAEDGEFLAFLDRARPRDRRVSLTARRPAARPEADRRDDVALAGYCPVALVKDRRLEAGQAEWTARYDGHEYRFSREERRDAFLKEPESFLPVDHGHCPVRQVDDGETVAGDPRFGVLYAGRLYLCADAEARDRFLKVPARYADADVADQGFCPHCRSQGGQLVRGRPRFAATHDGRRYLFPDAKHLAAFRAEPEKYLR